MKNIKYDEKSISIIDDSDFSELGKDIMQGLKEVIQYQRGEVTEKEGLKVYKFSKSNMKG